jgi:hypothetical protein
MAEEEKDDEAGEETSADEETSAPAPARNRVPWIVIGVLVLVMGGVGISAKKSETKPVKTEGSRAVVLPPGDRTRTVIVPPCSPRTVISPENATTLIEVQGTIAVALRQGEPARTIVIPRCSAQAAPAPGAPIVPAAAFVLGPGEQVTEVQSTKAPDPVAAGVKAQVTVPTGSPVTTIVAAPCQGKSETPRTTVLNPTGGSGVAIAPSC